MQQTVVETATSRSQVRRPNPCTTPPSQSWAKDAERRCNSKQNCGSAAAGNVRVPHSDVSPSATFIGAETRQQLIVLPATRWRRWRAANPFSAGPPSSRRRYSHPSYSLLSTPLRWFRDVMVTKTALAAVLYTKLFLNFQYASVILN